MSEATSTQNPNVTLEESLNNTDMGHWIYEHRKSFMASVIVVLLGTVCYVIWKQQQAAELDRLAAQVHVFEKAALEELRGGKMTPADFVSKFQALPKDVQTASPMVPVALSAANLLREKGDGANAYAILKLMMKEGGVKTSSLSYMFLVQNYAAMAETQGDTDEAIRVLEAYVASGNQVFLTKAYLDLGRLYLAKNDQAKAKKNLDYIIANHPNDELAKVARLYLQKMTTTP